MISKQEFSGKNLEEALNEAAKYYSVDKVFICYNTLSKKQGNFFSKIFSSKVQIEAWVETAKEDLQEAARKAVREVLQPKPVPQAPKINARTTEFTDPKVTDLIHKYNEAFFAAFSLSSENYSTEIKNNNFIVHVEDEYLEDLLAKSDKLSLAYEHVLKRLAQKKCGDISGRASLNAGSSASKREERLINIAKSLAEKVKKTGRNVILSSKSSQERKIIHLTLDGLDGIGTRSIGMGDKRRLVIFSTLKPEASSTDERKFKPDTKKQRPHPRKASKNSSQKKKESNPIPLKKELMKNE